ncbi:MAG TPA: divalent-cation tolerance protein CutA [Candidatus Kapabacteria bacterium]|jgi:periplasmic divalent cation tolerance protein|nr:divalent-cation tolerance protein CutA [Candidatus Kapabacteria bacterium]HOM05487.1 divalent-cation tolerance protein CutA [Candidatus Kapabacteria bacterium]
MKSFNEIRIVFTTASTAENADEIAQALLKEGLAACVSVIPNVTSYFIWKGSLDVSSEFILKIKTFEDKINLIEQRIKQLSNYELPEILVLHDIASSEEYYNWMKNLLF